MSDKKKTIREFFTEKIEALERRHGGKEPTDLLAIIRFDDGGCHVIHPNDKIIRLGLMEDLKLVVKEL
ncbi:hypothetical protein LCGC14_2919170 [marine sediment metagenome]|uniref:Uncharacterized protein n=1 Tax=marine sediment metagenome TaxID=412755 RepID=A0A0F8XPG9_9ZZZZ